MSDAQELLGTGLFDNLLLILEYLPSKTSQETADFMRTLSQRVTNEPGAARVIKKIGQLFPKWLDMKVDNEGNRPIHMAISKAKLDIFDALIEAGANPKAKNNFGHSSLDAASQVCANHRIQSAVSQAALESTKFSNANKSFALLLAVQYANLGAARTLIANGADCSIRFHSDFHAEMVSALDEAATLMEDENNVDAIVDLLLQTPEARQSIDLGWGREMGAPIHCASHFNTNTLNKLIAAGANINPHENGKFATPLMCAAKVASHERISILLNAGADAALVDANGENALHHLARNEDEMDAKMALEEFGKCLDALSKSGCDPLARNAQGNTPRDLAAQNGLVMLCNLLDECTLCTQTPRGVANKTVLRL